ncbi:MAG: PAS domain S-box protein [Syntrophaceae bacterium]|nr:PAS domain S-box protein [Syntrophaceae bacterium]
MTRRKTPLQFQSFFQQPRVSGEDAVHRPALLLHHLTNSVLALSLLSLLIVIPFFYVRKEIGAACAVAVVIVTLVCRYLLHGESVRGSAALFLSFLWIVFFLAIVSGKGLGDANIAIIIALIVMSGLLLGQRIALGTAAVSIVAFLGLALLEGSHVLPLNFFPQPPLAKWSQYALAIVIIVLMLNHALRALDRSLQSARRQSQDRQAALDSLRESQELLSRIVNAIPDIVIRINMEGVIEYVNDHALKVSGYRREEMTGADMMAFIVSEDRDRAFLNMVRMQDGPLGAIEYKFILKSGERLSAEVNGDVLRRGDGSPYGAVFACRDVTDRRTEEEQRRIAMNNSQSGIFIASGGLLRYINPKAIFLSGYTEEELLGTPSMRYVHLEDREMAGQHARDMLAGKRTTPYEYRILTKTGGVRWLMGTFTPAMYQGQRAVLGEMMDVTELREAREELERMQDQLLQAKKLESLGTLAGGIAHDFNNLLMGIQGYASLMLLDTGESHPHYEKLKAIESQVRSGSDLTRQLLGFARGGRYEVKPTDLNSLLGKTAHLFSRTRKEIRLFERYAEKPWTVEVDRGQLEQVFLNLFVNAWQAMPGGGDLHVETANVMLDEDDARADLADAGPYVKVSITDTGVGMDDRTRLRIFDPFFTTKEMGRGTGLGLASVYGIVKGHGGFIRVSSAPGRGTTFVIYLPASGKALAVEPFTWDGGMSRGHETILVVDDEDMIREVTKEMLEGLGYRVLTAGDGGEAVSLFRSERKGVDVVILDMIMPGIGGGEVYDALRALDPGVRVILSSGYSLDGQARAIMERGIRDFLQKPFRIEDLSRKIRSVLAE